MTASGTYSPCGNVCFSGYIRSEPPPTRNVERPRADDLPQRDEFARHDNLPPIAIDLLDRDASSRCSVTPALLYHRRQRDARPTQPPPSATSRMVGADDLGA